MMTCLQFAELSCPDLLDIAENRIGAYVDVKLRGELLLEMIDRPYAGRRSLGPRCQPLEKFLNQNQAYR
jgi:hypothetical protein